MSPRAHPLATGLIPTDDSASGLVLEERFELSRPRTPGSEPGASSSSATRAQAVGRIGGGRRRSRSPDPEVRTAFETGLVLDQFVFPERRWRRAEDSNPSDARSPLCFQGSARCPNEFTLRRRRAAESNRKPFGSRRFPGAAPATQCLPSGLLAGGAAWSRTTNGMLIGPPR